MADRDRSKKPAKGREIRRHEVASDARLCPEGRLALSSLRGGMVDAAEKHPLPKRFKVAPEIARPAMTITDMETGRRCTVGLYAYGAVREALNELYG